MTKWQLLKDIKQADVPKEPGVYLLKLIKSSKVQFVGCTKDLNRHLNLRDLTESASTSLEEFLTRHFPEIVIRYEPTKSIEDADNKVKSIILSHKEKHDRKPPAFN